MNKQSVVNTSKTETELKKEEVSLNSNRLRETLTVWVPEDYYDQIEQIINDDSTFDDEYGIDLDIDLKSFSNEELYQRMTTAIDEGDAPDLILTTDDSLVKIVELDPSSFLRLGDYFELNSFSNFKLGELMQSNDDIYGIPFSGGPVAYYYNKDLFDAAGASLHDNMTWDEFFEEGRKLLDCLNLPILPLPDRDDVYTMMKARGVCFYEDSENVTADGSYEVISFFENLYSAGLICDQSYYDANEKLAQFLNEKIAGFMCSPYMIKKLEDQVPGTNCENLGIIKLPKSDGFDYDVSLYGESWLIKDSSDDDRNQLVVDWLRNVVFVNMENLIREKKLIPVEESVIDECAYLEDEPYFNANVIYFLAQIGQDIPIVIKGPYSRDLSGLLNEKIKLVFTGEITPDEAYDQFSSEMERYVEENGNSGGDSGGDSGGGSGGDSGGDSGGGSGGDSGGGSGGIKYRAYLEISQLPDKVEYTEGEYFEKSGMVLQLVTVAVVSGEKTYNTIKDGYSVNKNSPLKRGDETVIVSYVFDRKIYTVPLKIKVKASSGNLKNKACNTFGDFPSVNLLTGNITYESGDVSIGANRNAISISHVYNSDAINFYKNLNTGIGKGWKLNIQQYLLTIGNSLYYIDAQGYMHEFRDNTIEGASDIYQDVEGENLTLYKNYTFENEKCSLLKDSGDNYILFDAAGRMIKMIPAPCSFENLETARATIIKYADDKIEKVYDSKSPNTCLEFGYSGSYISKIIVKIGTKIDKEINFTCDDNGNLISRKKGDIVETYGYGVAGSLLKQVISEETKSAVKIEYWENTDRVSSTANGYIDNEGEFVQKSKNDFTYTLTSGGTLAVDEGLSSTTTVVNEKGISIVYMFNSLGELTTSFEKLGTGGFNTLQNETGKKIIGISKNVGSVSINESGTNSCSGGVVTYDGEFSLCRSGEESTKNFTVFCFVKLENETLDSVQAIIRYKFDSKNYTSSVKIDNNAIGVWQKVAVPLSIPKESEVTDAKISSFSFGIYDENGGGVSFQYNNIRVIPGSHSAVILSGNGKSLKLKDACTVEITAMDDSKKILRIGKKVSVNGTDAVAHIIPFTYNDLLETAKSLYRHRSGGGEFFFGGGKDRYSEIKSVKILDDGDEYDLIDLSTGKCGFIYEEYSADNTSVTRVQTTFQPDGVLSETTISNDEKSSMSKEFTSYDGRKIYEEDAYKVRTVYEYDDFYNVKRIKREKLSTSGNILKEMVLSEAQYDANGEYMENSSSGYSSSAYTYNKPYESIIKETERSFDLKNQSYSYTSLNKNIVYDPNGRVSSVSLKSSNREIFRNDITYKDGKIRTVTDGSVKYGIKYDIANDEVSYTIFDGDMERDVQKHIQKYDETVKRTISTELYYRGEETDIITAVSDIYGRALSLGDGKNTVKYTYTDEFNGYDGADLIKTVFDPYENRIYTYNYDHDGKMCGWNISDDTLAVRQIYGAETKYIFNGSEKYKTESVYDENVVNQPRLTGTKVYSDSDNNASDDWTEMTTYTCEYGYDEIGRINRKAVGEGVYDYTYLTTGKGGLLPNIQTIKYSFSQASNPSKWTYTHSYDNKGNLTTVTTNKTVGGLSSRVSAYTYDEANRMTNETITEGGVKKLSRTYTYQSSGRGKLWGITDNLDATKSKYFYYDNRGRIGYYSENNKNYVYAYDNYGNVVSKQGNTGSIYQCSWERGNLLKQVIINGKTVKYEYNRQNVRFKKTSGGVVTNYYLDGSKILGEDRGGNKLRYFYDNDGLIGLSYNGSRYRYIKDGQENIVGIVNESGVLEAQYEYDSNGNTTVKTSTGAVNTSSGFIGNINPFRWKSFYYDAETGFYNANGRYYEIERGGYIDAIEADIIEGNAYDLLGLDRNGIMQLTLLLLAPYSATIATEMQLYADPTYNPNEGVVQEPESPKKWWKRHWKEVLLSALNIVVGVVKLATGNPMGVLNIVSGVIGLVGAIVSEQLAGAMGTATLGMQTIMIGIQSLCCSVAYGLVAIAAGAGCVAFATAEAQESLGYGNWMKDAGMSDGWYSGLMVATNVAAIAVNIAGPKQCFKEGTLVACLNERGEEVRMPIESIAVGTLVLAYDEATGEQAYKAVKQLFRNETLKWCTIAVAVAGIVESITSTPGHKYYLPENTINREIGEKQEHASYTGLSEKWVSACKLKAGDKVLLSNGEYGIIQSVKVEELSSPETTYNLEVEDFHTYYVGENPVCVHNVGCQNPDQKALTEIIKENGKNKPLSMNDAETLASWGKEYGMNIRIDSGHSMGSAVSRAPHLHTGFNGWHIPIIGR